MKNMGEKNYVIGEECGQAAHEADDRKWYQKIVKLMHQHDIDPVFVGRPGGKGWRLDVTVLAQFADMALEIKEATRVSRFKNTNDIHRAAHYIGMYIIREIELGSKGKGLSAMYRSLEECHMEQTTKVAIRKEFRTHLENFGTGIISEERLEWVMNKMLENIHDPKLRAWAEQDMMESMNAPGSYERIINKLRVRKTREKKKELGLSLVSSED